MFDKLFVELSLDVREVGGIEKGSKLDAGIVISQSSSPVHVLGEINRQSSEKEGESVCLPSSAQKYRNTERVSLYIN